MGRHADTLTRGRLARPVVAGAVLLPLVLVGGLVWWIADGVGSATCSRTEVVRVTVAPELAEVTEEVLSDAEGLTAADCARAEVSTQEPVQTVGDLAALEASALPQIWVPDSSAWTARLDPDSTAAEVDAEGSMASSPVVLATSAAAVGTLGWADDPPGWQEAFGSAQPMAMPDLATSAEGVAALGALRSSGGGQPDADDAVVRVVLAAGRGASLSVEDALASAATDAPDAPLVPVREQEVWAHHQQEQDSGVVAVYPREGSPSLDYPVLRVGSADGAAVDAVVRALTSEAARSAVLEAGFRAPDGTAPEDAGPGTGTREAAPEAIALEPESVRALTDELADLAVPSRILTVVDVSTSMEAPVGSGTRATLARDAAKSALALVPGDYALGLWVFADSLEGAQDWAQLVPTRGLDVEVAGRTQRRLLGEQLDTVPARLAPGGTGLYDTALAAVRAARADHDPTAVNSVLLLTDGTNDDPDGITADQLLEALRAESDPERPVKVIGVALGPDADLQALQQIAEATGGAAYSAVDENDLQTVLFDALRQRR